MYTSTGNVVMCVSEVCIYLWRRGRKGPGIINTPLYNSAIDFISSNSLVTIAVV